MDEATRTHQITGRLRPKWPACGQCPRCLAGTGQPVTRDADCYAEFLHAQSAAAAHRAGVVR